MKSILFTISKHATVSAALLVLVAAPFAPLVAMADTPTSGTDASYYGTTVSGAPLNPAAQAQNWGNLDPNLSPATPSPVAPSGNSVPNECKWNDNWSLCITNVIYALTVGIGSGFAYVSAYFFDWAIALSLNGSSYALSFVSQGWTTARDMANMAFLFILLYIAFKVMFEAETNETVHMLTVVIVVALLVNFSFFFTRLAIDAGNILSIQFYNAIQAPPVSASPAAAASALTSAAGALGTGSSSFSNSKDLTASIMGMLNLQGLFNTDSFQRWYDPNKDGGKSGPSFMVVLTSLSFLYISAGIMFWLLTVAFITNGVKFLFRIVVLWFLIIASPLAFVAKAVPRFEKYYTQWQDELIKHAFYPAAFMFIFLILTNFTSQMGQNNQFINGMFAGLSAANAASPVAAIGYAVANVGIRMGFILAMLYVGMEASKAIGVMGANIAEHAGNWVGGVMKTSTLGLSYQQGVGRAAGMLNSGLANTRIGNSLVGQRLRGWTLQPLAGAKVGGVRSFTEYKDSAEKLKAERDAGVRDIENREAVQRIAQKIEENKKAGRPHDAGINKADKDRVQNLTDREFEAMKAKDVRKLTPMLSEKQIDRISKLAKFSEQDRDGIKTEWRAGRDEGIQSKTKGALAALNSGVPPARVSGADKRAVQTLTQSDFKIMSPDDLIKISALISEDTKKKLLDNDDIPEGVREKAIARWEEHAEASPLRKSLKKLEEVADNSATGTIAIAARRAAGLPVDTAWVKTILNPALETEHGVNTIQFNSQTAKLNAAAVELTKAQNALAAAPANAALVTAERAAAATHAAAESATTVAHAAMNKSQKSLSAFKDFDENRRNIESHANINSNGTKGTFNASYL